LPEIDPENIVKALEENVEILRTSTDKHNLTLVTRETEQVPSMGVAVFNPWKKS
jgi:hypothetical protein